MTRGTIAWPSAVGLQRGARSALLTAMLVVVAACSSGAAAPTKSPVPITGGPSPAPTVRVSAQPTPTRPPSLAPKPTVAIVKVTPIPGAADSGIVVKMTTNSAYWLVDHLDAPAGKRWQVQIDDLDGSGHNFIVGSGPSVPERIYTSPNFGLAGKGMYTFDIPALPAGSYLFICAFHPKMVGTLTIR